jgi:hypothetical protein
LQALFEAAKINILWRMVAKQWQRRKYSRAEKALANQIKKTRLLGKRKTALVRLSRYFKKFVIIRVYATTARA